VAWLATKSEGNTRILRILLIISSAPFQVRLTSAGPKKL
jgi:hypothetical protein